MRRYVAWLNSLTTRSWWPVTSSSKRRCPPATLLRRSALAAVEAGGRDFPETTTSGCAGARRARMVNLPATLLDWREGAERLTRPIRATAWIGTWPSSAARWPRSPARRGRGALWGRRDGRAFADGLLRAGIRVAAFVEVDRKKVGGPSAAAVHSFEEVERCEACAPGGVVRPGPRADPGELDKRGFESCATTLRGVSGGSLAVVWEELRAWPDSAPPPCRASIRPVQPDPPTAPAAGA